MELDNKIRFPKGIEIGNFTSLLWDYTNKKLVQKFVRVLMFNFLILRELRQQRQRL